MRARSPASKVAHRRGTSLVHHVAPLAVWAAATLAATGCSPATIDGGRDGGQGGGDGATRDGFAGSDGTGGGADLLSGPDGSGGPLSPTPWTELNVGGGGNDSGLSISAKGVRFVRGDVFGGWAWGKDNRYHQVVTIASMPAADLGLFPSTNTAANQAWSGASGVMELVGCPSSAACAYMYFNGYVYYSGNVDTANLGALTWCRSGGFKQTTETSNNVVAAGDPGQFMAIDPANAAHVLVGTPSTGLFETFNGQACASTTWSAIPTTSIPLGMRVANGSPYPGYAIAFDPTSATQGCPGGAGTCSSKAYVYTAGGATPGVYMTTDAGRSWTATAGGPKTVQHLKVSAASAGGGHVWATDASADAWELIGTSWQQIASLKGHAGDVAINPSNGDHIVASGGYVSVDGAAPSPTFVNYPQHFSGAGDAPWQAWTNLSKLTGPNALEFDPLGSGETLIAIAGQGAWKTTFPTAAFTWTAETAGIEGLVGSQIAVGAALSPSIGAGDESGCRFSIATAGMTPSTCFPQASMLLLSYAHGLSTVPGQNLMLSKNSPDYSGGFDSSGTSTDGFASDYTPFNLWNTTVPATALAPNGSTSCSGGVSGGACTRVTVPSTAGLKTFAPGDRFTDKSIVCALSTLEYWAGSFGGEGRCYPITVVDATHFDLTYPYYGATQSSPGYTYQFWVPAAALEDWNAALTITDVTDDGGLVKVTTNLGIGVGANWPVCIEGVTMAGATAVNGCWVVTNPTNTGFSLAASKFVVGDKYTTGGVAKTWGTPGGGVAASTATEWSIYGADKTFPSCTTNGGATWTQIRTANNAELTSAGATVVNKVSAGATSLTASTTGVSGGLLVQLASGRWFHLTSDIWGSPPNVNGATITFNGAAVPPGDSIPSGATLYSTDTGWAWAAFLFNHMIVADQVTPNTFYGVNYNAGLMRWTDCKAPTVIVPKGAGQADWYAWLGYNASLKAVPKEAGHLFLAAGPQGSMTHPTGTQLSRMCNAGGTSPSWQRVTGIFEPQAFGFGAPAPGHTYPTEYVVGWYSPTDDIKDAQYGIWESVDDANDGATGACSLKQTWTNIGTAAQNAPGGFPLGWFSGVIDISGDPFVHGPVYYSGSFGAFYGVFP